MATLITGGAGFIGSHLANRLASGADSVIVLDNFDAYYDPRLKRANVAAFDPSILVVEGDVRDELLIERLFRQHEITRVAHLAAMSGVRNSVQEGRLYADVNTSGSVTLMDAARRHNVQMFVQASTSSVYGNANQIPFQESYPSDYPLAPYPASKRAVEMFAHSYHHLFGLNITVLRFFNVYGPKGRPDMMPLKAIDAILHDKPITLYDGGDLKRDWTYVDDTVQGVIAALDRPMGFRIINLGYGAPASLLEFMQIYENLIGKKAIIRSEPAPLTEPRITYCDNTLARTLLGFDPQVTLAQGLAHTWNWYRSEYGIDLR